MKKDELPQEMVDRLKREENEANPMVKLRDKIFGPEKKKEPKQKPGNVMLEGTGEGVIKKAKGGTASARADGIAQRGKTRGKIV